MKTILISLLLLITSISYGQSEAKEITATDRNFDFVCLGEWLEVAVSDTGAADTVLVYYPITSITGTTVYALCGSIKEIATNNNVVGLYGDADQKVYVIWLPEPRAVRFTLSQYASGDVYIRAAGK